MTFDAILLHGQANEREGKSFDLRVTSPASQKRMKKLTVSERVQGGN
jgi:hypothetical protein